MSPTSLTHVERIMNGSSSSPESSVPIDCSEEEAAREEGTLLASEHYVCPGGQGVACLDAASVLCDLNPDCPGAADEHEKGICGKFL